MTQIAQTDKHTGVEDLIIEQLADGRVLVGTLRMLAHGLGVRVVELQTALRQLLEVRTIAVSTEMHGQLTIRLERRREEAGADRRPPLDRRQPKADIWVL